MAKLHFRYGTMGSAKTALALMHVYNFKEKGNKALLCKPAIDTRSKDVWSRIGLSDKAITVDELCEMGYEQLSQFRVVVIDEAQFMTPEQVDNLCPIVDYLDIPVFCYGLRTDYTSSLFPGAKRLMEVADEIEEIKTSCWCGKSAKFNARIVDGKILRDAEKDNPIDIENKSGSQKYTALCRKHYLSGEYLPQKNSLN